MYDYVEGRLSELRPGHLVIDVGGVGYELSVPLTADFPARDGRVRAWAHLIVREDAQRLFGFSTREQREHFRLLLEVRGVGPAVALAILSCLPGDELLQAIAAQDTRPFLRVKGVGKKTAEQILLDLREKATRQMVRAEQDTLVPRPGDARSVEDAVRALLSIGYSEKEAQKSVERARAKVPDGDLERLVRAALQP